MNDNYHPQAPTPLATTAMLYVCGDMADSEAADFEALLAIDQEARDALAEAVALLTPLANGRVPGLNPAYRDAVRQRFVVPPLGGRSQTAPPQGGTTNWFGPLVWTLTGAAAASILWMLFLPPGQGAPGSAESPSMQNAPIVEAAAHAPMEAVFADLRNLDNIERVHQQHQQQKQKQDDFKTHHRANQGRPLPPGGGGATM
jgi:hypothetical protein